MPTKFSCPLSFHTLEPCARRGEPVSVGLPWPRGAISDEKYFQLIGPDGSPKLLQTKVLNRWPDGSVRWCTFDLLATWDGKTRESGYRVEVGDKANALSKFGKSLCPEKLFDLITDETEQPVFPGEITDSGSVRQRRKMSLKSINGCEQFSEDVLEKFPGELLQLKAGDTLFSGKFLEKPQFLKLQELNLNNCLELEEKYLIKFQGNKITFEQINGNWLEKYISFLKKSLANNSVLTYSNKVMSSVSPKILLTKLRKAPALCGKTIVK